MQFKIELFPFFSNMYCYLDICYDLSNKMAKFFAVPINDEYNFIAAKEFKKFGIIRL